MRSLLAVLLALEFLATPSRAQPAPPPQSPMKPVSVAPNAATPAPRPSNTEAMQASLDRLTQTNHDLIELLKKQQAVLEDIQYDRRLQSRQIQSLVERLQDSLMQNAQLQSKVSSLEATAASTPAPASPTNPAPATPTPPTLVDAPPPPPSTYLPPPAPEGMPGTKSWHRLFTLSGTESKSSDLFHIQGRNWRVLWHNEDPAGKAYKNTSALFVSAFPKDDTIPQKVCSKLGSGGDSSELAGPGNYYLKVEASGGSWELAVEDFR